MFLRTSRDPGGPLGPIEVADRSALHVSEEGSQIILFSKPAVVPVTRMLCALRLSIGSRQLATVYPTSGPGFLLRSSFISEVEIRHLPGVQIAIL